MSMILNSIVFVTLFSLVSVSEASTDTFYCDLDTMLDDPKTVGLFYEISFPGRPNSYLFGSAHLGYKRFTSLPKKVKEIIERTDYFYLEYVSSEQDQYTRDDFNFLPADKSIETVLRQSTYLRLLDVLRASGFAEERILNNRDRTPIFFATLIQPKMPLFSNSNSLDDLVVAAAKEKGLKIRSLEDDDSVMSGYRLVTDSDWSDYIDALLEISGNPQKLIFEKQFNYCEFESIRLGDAKQMERNALDSDRLRPAQSKITKLLGKTRNNSQANAVMETVAANDGVNFFSLGARHLVGEDGVIERLKRKGFVVRQLK